MISTQPPSDGHFDSRKKNTTPTEPSISATPTSPLGGLTIPCQASSSEQPAQIPVITSVLNTFLKKKGALITNNWGRRIDATTAEERLERGQRVCLVEKGEKTYLVPELANTRGEILNDIDADRPTGRYIPKVFPTKKRYLFSSCEGVIRHIDPSKNQDSETSLIGKLVQIRKDGGLILSDRLMFEITPDEAVKILNSGGHIRVVHNDVVEREIGRCTDEQPESFSLFVCKLKWFFSGEHRKFIR
jgi:hypothetical protein